MRPRRVMILDLATKGPTNSLFARGMNQILANIMPQAICGFVRCRGNAHCLRAVEMARRKRKARR